MRRDMLGGANGGGTMPVGELLYGVAEVAEQMPSICHLDSVRRALTDPVGIRASTITGDDLDARMTAQPPTDCRRFAVRQQIDDLVRLQVHQHRAVAATPPPSPVVDPKNPGSRLACFSA